MKRVRDQAIRGGAARIGAQMAQVLVRLGTLVILARFLNPSDFGLVGMVTAITGVLSIFRDFGLSTAAIQRASITDSQASTLFWVNLAFGAALWVLTSACAPLLVQFYREPQLLSVTLVLAASFPITAAGVQHGVRLQREMRFESLAAIDVVSLLTSSAVGIALAISGLGYWALVGWSLALVSCNTMGVWLLSAWVPQRPARDADIGSLVRFGGKVTLNSAIVYIAYNLDKILIGRVWGATALGTYGRAYQLISLPTDNLIGAIGGVAFAGLSRVSHDQSLLRSYFLKGFKIILSVIVPIAAFFLVFAEELVWILLGPKWNEVVPIFRLLIPTLLVLAIINPPGWLLFALGMIGRSLKIGIVIAVLVITAVVIGLPHGPQGVALGLSTALMLWVVPHIFWSVKGTNVSPSDLFRQMAMPLLAGAIATLVAIGLAWFLGEFLTPVWRALLGGAVLLATYLAVLLYPTRDRDFYVGLFSALHTHTRVG